MHKNPTIKLVHPCQFGSGVELRIGQNSAHAVLAIRENGLLNSIALTPDGLRTLAASLSEIADKLEGKDRQPETPWYPNGKPGWVEWGGGECPVPRRALVEVLYRIGRSGHLGYENCASFGNAGSFRWTNTDDDYGIVAYRVVEAG